LERAFSRCGFSVVSTLSSLLEKYFLKVGAAPIKIIILDLWSRVDSARLESVIKFNFNISNTFQGKPSEEDISMTHKMTSSIFPTATSFPAHKCKNLSLN
jgi:hypothetical protein